MPTSWRGTSGGPAAISAALVPLWMRRLELVSTVVCSICDAWRAALGAISGDLGPIWISAGGGGLGSRGELGGIDMTLDFRGDRERCRTWGEGSIEETLNGYRVSEGELSCFRGFLELPQSD